jgi:peptidyl-dipeptidase A
MFRFVGITILVALLTSCGSSDKIRTEVQMFIDEYTSQYQKLYYESAKAQWASNTKIVEGDSTNAVATRKANEAFAKFTGSTENINRAQKYLSQKDKLLPLQVKQLERILYLAADNPETVEELVKQRIKAETEQTENLFGFDFKIDGKSVSTNEIDERLKKQTDVSKRLETWQASKEVGKTLKDGLENLRNLRNETVQALGYDDYFTYQVSDYGMSTEEMTDLTEQMVKEVYPIYRELHTYARYELAKKYGVSEVPDYLPAHWLPNRWGQDWNEMISVEGLDLDQILKKKTAEWLVKQGERFYMSLGFPSLPPVFWEKSSLYPLPPGADYKKNNHASAWHMDLENDVRSLMSVVPNASWYETVNHELGHIYYYICYTNPDVPPLLREGANRGFHEAMGSLMGLAAMQKPFIKAIGLLPENAQTDDQRLLLKEALNFIVFIPWSAGVMTQFEHELYSENLPVDKFNEKWWALKKRYQGIVPPNDRGEEYCDAASKTHINNDAAQYYDYALSYLLLFQFHDYISNNILKQDSHSTNYYGSKEVGDFLKEIMTPGASVDWRRLLREKMGEDLSAKAMMRYFEPLMQYLKEANKGRKYTLQPIDV